MNYSKLPGVYPHLVKCENSSDCSASEVSPEIPPPHWHGSGSQQLLSRGGISSQSRFMVVSWNKGYPQIIHLSGIFPYKPTILGIHHLWKPPFGLWLFHHIFSFWSLCLSLAVKKNNSSKEPISLKIITTVPFFHDSLPLGWSVSSSRPAEIGQQNRKDVGPSLWPGLVVDIGLLQYFHCLP